jgi:hypothetical protein
MKLEEWELLDLKLRRQNKPPTMAREARFYGDPSKIVEFEAEKKRKAVKQAKKYPAQRPGRN